MEYQIFASTYHIRKDTSPFQMIKLLIFAVFFSGYLKKMHSDFPVTIDCPEFVLPNDIHAE